MRFEAGRWVDHDGNPVSTDEMLTAGPGTKDNPPASGDPRRASTTKSDPRKNRQKP